MSNCVVCRKKTSVKRIGGRHRPRQLFGENLGEMRTEEGIVVNGTTKRLDRCSYL